MPRHNWDKIIENLKNHPGEEILVAELAQGGQAVQRLRDAGMEIRKERVTSKLFNLYARYPLPDGASEIPRSQQVCPNCGARCSWEVCDCPLDCFKPNDS